MRALTLLAALSITLCHAAMNGYTEERDPALPDDVVEAGEIGRDPVARGAGSGCLQYTAVRGIVDHDEHE